MKTTILKGLLFELYTQTNTASVIRCIPNATSISIPSSIAVDGITYRITYIGKEAFSDCTSLKKINIPDSVTSIEESAFSGCSALKKIAIPDSVTSIGDFAFAHCRALKEIIIPNSVTSIGDFAFKDCTSLKRGVFLCSVSRTHFGKGLFEGCPT